MSTFSLGTARGLDIDVARLGMPTEYAGVMFRSRLEAKWAAFFDLAKWSWTYEPFDLAGYIPDFIVETSRKPLLVEVKPSAELRELEPHAAKIRDGGWTGDFLIVGACMLSGPEHPLSLGLLGIWDGESNDGWWPADHAEAIECPKCERVSVRHASGGHFCVLWGASGRFAAELSEPARLRRLWGQAGNDVQWRGAESEIRW